MRAPLDQAALLHERARQVIEHGPGRGGTPAIRMRQQPQRTLQLFQGTVDAFEAGTASNRTWMSQRTMRLSPAISR
jgi:hypothetical protein